MADNLTQGRMTAQMADICPNGRYSLEMIFLPRWQISAQMADIPPQMADFNGRRWADLLSQIPDSPISNPCEYGDSGPSSSTTKRDLLLRWHSNRSQSQGALKFLELINYSNGHTHKVTTGVSGIN